MRKSVNIIPQLCKELKLHQNNLMGHYDANNFVDQIYKKYFKDLVQDVHNEGDQCTNHLKDLLTQRSNQSTIITPTDDDVWIFGYGSLVWKADFPYIDRRRGYICGYQRRFYQHSIDHRGTLEKPGRVVTLLPTNDVSDRVYGIAYRIASQQKLDVLQHLDYREKNGYERCSLEFHEFPEVKDGHFGIIMYIATQVNESYAGEIWQLPRIAEQIFTSAGPSGRNREYLFNLANVMRELFPGVQDEHLFDLEKEVRKRIERDEVVTIERAIKYEIKSILTSSKNDEGVGDVDVDDNEVELTVKHLENLKDSCTKPGWKEAILTKELILKQMS